MNFLEKLLKTEVQTKKLSEVDVKKIKREMSKKGYKISEEDIKNRIQEIEEAYEMKTSNRCRNIAFVVTILSLLTLAIQEELLKDAVFTLSSFDKFATIAVAGILIAASWLACYFRDKHNAKAVLITFITGVVLEIAMILAIIFV